MGGWGGSPVGPIIGQTRKKRHLSKESSEDDSERKKFKISLNLSGTFDRISEIELSDESFVSAEASLLYDNCESSESVSFSGNRTRLELSDTLFVSAQLNDSRSTPVSNDENDLLEVTESSIQVVEDNENILHLIDLY